MTQEQFLAMLRQIIPFVSGIAVGKGWLTPSAASDVGTLILQIGGPLFAAGSAYWAHTHNSKQSILTTAANMPEVKEIKLDATKSETASLNASTPTNVKT